MAKRISSKITTVVFVVSVYLGLFLIIAPLVLARVNKTRSDAKINAYEQSVAEETDRIEAMLVQADKYNQDLTQGVEGASERYEEMLVTKDGVMGYIEIPRINIRDPIYHTVKEDVLQKGIGHMPSTSLPVGGIGTHAALSGHRGLPSSRLFTDLDQVKDGDIILIKVLTRQLAYEVYNIEVVNPDSTGNLEVDPDDDLLTLVTCTPYAVNTHRLLVHARRTEYKEEIAGIAAEHTISESDRILLIALGIVVVILALDIVVVLKRHQRIRKAEKPNKR